jgi:hypothetical protein
MYIARSWLFPVSFAGFLIKCIPRWASAAINAVECPPLFCVAFLRRLAIVSLGGVAPVLLLVISSCMRSRSQPTSCIPWPSCAVWASSPLGWWPLFCFLLFPLVCGRSPPAAYRGLHAPFGHPPVLFRVISSCMRSQPTKLQLHRASFLRLWHPRICPFLCKFLVDSF